nr:integrase, catalytic region, zinc finger, CCHC-type, peptidase aspartic, catalytic [Tanacetum cinerariifolium]
MMRNLKLLVNFMEKFLGTVRVGNDQFALILRYGDLVQGNVTIKKDVHNAVQNPAWAEGNANGNDGTQIRCYNYKGLGHLARNCTVMPRRRDAAYLQTQLLIAQKEEVGI